jgi:hypothetical protein
MKMNDKADKEGNAAEEASMREWARQRQGDGRPPVTAIWKWNTPQEAVAFLDGVEWVNDSALKAWIEEDHPSNVLVYDDETPADPGEWPDVRHGG